MTLGEMADLFFEAELERVLFGYNYDEEPDYYCPEISPLDLKTWTTKDGTILKPAKDMSENHIHNVQRILCSKKGVDFLKDIDLTRRSNGAVLYNMVSIEYIEKRIKTSKLWKELQKGLKRHEKLNKKVNDLNKGILEI